MPICVPFLTYFRLLNVMELYNSRVQLVIMRKLHRKMQVYCKDLYTKIGRLVVEYNYSIKVLINST